MAGNKVKISLRHLKKRFGRLQVLTDANLDIYEGETMVIIGKSGTGKSVILKHIMGLLLPDGGRILIDGDEITNPKNVDIYKIRKKLGMLFQGSALFDSMSVGENIAFAVREHKHPPESEINKLIARSLEMVDLQATISKKMPAELSGGMKKRVGLARVIAMDPEVILYDEPTTGLDPITSDTINQLIINMQKRLKVTTIVVTHDMVSAYKVSDRIAMLHDDGKIIFTGSADQLRASRNPQVQQFIRGQKKPYYEGRITPEEQAAQFDEKFDISLFAQRENVRLCDACGKPINTGQKWISREEGGRSFVYHELCADAPGA
jgi:phospholipid/cholesterol/gamma-HCH transport system ATP-binding protein